jgi:signal recognition particle receptor subunit beta
VQVDFRAREITIKIVYYGPALSGKTTNLQALHRLVAQDQRTRLMALETRNDRTLFFDLLPMTFRHGDISLRFKVFTVPGQVIHNATRRLVLQGADGVAFVADSQISETKANAEAFAGLKRNLHDLGIEIETIPLVIQYNKRDLPEIRSDAELDELAQRSREPVFRAVAVRDEGVAETFVGLIQGALSHLEVQTDLGRRFGVSTRNMLEDVCSRLQLSTEIRPEDTFGRVP